MMRKLLILLTLPLLLAQSASAQKLIAHYGTVEDSYNFWVCLPQEDTLAAYDSLPVVVFLHGRSLCGTDLNQVLRYGTVDAVEKGLKLNAIVVAPQNPGSSWKPDKLMPIVDWCLEKYHGCRNRVYVLGMSLGGYGAVDFAGSYPDRIAAAVGLCGGSTLKDFSGLSKVPLWLIHGTADKAVPLRESVKVVNGIRSASHGERLVSTWLDGLDHGRLARCFFMPVFYDWLFSHSLEDEGRPANLEVSVSSTDVNNAYQNINFHAPKLPRSTYKSNEVCGAYSEQREPTAEEMELFKAVAGANDMAFTPLSVSTQVVAGTNYKFWCRYQAEDDCGHCWVIIYKPLPGQGEPRLSSIEKE